ncbi:hypothetical protein GR7B_00018 [Vibrio phage vB_VcorM_GR7B]|nr:hypothetical protein GR7B_00018 [Vibrio phage vB_VcorM_GR7B]
MVVSMDKVTRITDAPSNRNQKSADLARLKKLCSEIEDNEEKLAQLRKERDVLERKLLTPDEYAAIVIQRRANKLTW